MYLKTDLKRAKWVRKTSEEFASQTYINALVEFNGKIYGGSYPTPLLLEWNGADDWIMRSGEVGTPPNEELGIESLAVFNGKIYGGTHPRGKLAEWNGSNAWVEVAPQFGSETQIYALAVYNGKLYGASHPGGKLLEWNGSNAWVEVAPKHGDETKIHCLLVFDNKLYAGTYPHGKLLRWNDSDAWVEVAGQPSGESWIVSLCEFEGELYGGGYAGKLYKWDGSDAWVEVAAGTASPYPIWTLTVFKDKLIGCTGNNGGGTLLEWNGSNAWTLRIAGSPLYTHDYGPQTICSAIVFKDTFYAGTENGAMLFQLDWAKPEQADVSREDELKIYIMPPGTAQIDPTTIEQHRISPQNYTLKREINDERFKARELEITTDRRTPIGLFSRVVAVEAGQVILNGYVERLLSKSKESKKYLIKGNEGRLFGRVIPKIAIAKTSHLDGVISHLLWLVDSYWPPGTPYNMQDVSKNIVKLNNADTKTELSKYVLSIREQGVHTKLTAYSALADLQTYDYSYYVSNEALYIRASNSNWYSMGGLYADRMFDTFLRLGHAHPYETFSSQRVLGPDHEEAAQYLYEVIRSNGFYIHLSDDFNYTYINYDRAIGIDTNRVIYERDLIDFEESTPAAPIVTAMICKGDFQFATNMDGSLGSPFFAFESFPNTYLRPMGLLKEVALEAFQRRNSEQNMSIVCRRKLMQDLSPGDTFYIHLEDEAPRRVQLAQISISQDGKTKAQLGGRIKGVTDFWKDKLENNVYEDDFLQVVLPEFSETATFKPRDKYHNTCTLGSITFTFPSGIKSSYGQRFLALLDLSLSIEDLYSVGPYPWKFTVWVNGTTGDWGNISEGFLDEGLHNVDVTDLLVEGSNTIQILAQYSEEFTTVHSACADGQQYFNLPWMGVYREWKGHPDLSANVKIKFYQMLGAF
jgi:hypothetical protein